MYLKKLLFFLLFYNSVYVSNFKNKLESFTVYFLETIGEFNNFPISAKEFCISNFFNSHIGYKVSIGYYYGILPFYKYIIEIKDQFQYVFNDSKPIIDQIKKEKKNNYFNKFFNLAYNIIKYYFFGSLVYHFFKTLSSHILYCIIATKDDDYHHLERPLEKLFFYQRSIYTKDINKNLNTNFETYRNIFKNIQFQNYDAILGNGIGISLLNNIFPQYIINLSLSTKNFNQLKNKLFKEILFFNFFEEYIYLGLIILFYFYQKTQNTIKMSEINNKFLSSIKTQEKITIKFKNTIIGSQSLRVIFFPKSITEKKILFLFKEIKSLIKNNQFNFNKQMPSYFLLILGKSGKTTVLNIVTKYIKDTMNMYKIKLDQASFLGRVPELANRIKKNQLKRTILDAFQLAFTIDQKEKCVNCVLIENIDSVLRNRSQSLQIDNYVILNNFLTVFNVAGEFNEKNYSGFLIGTADNAKNIDPAALRRLKFISLDFKNLYRLNRIILMKILLNLMVKKEYKKFFIAKNIKKDLKIFNKNLKDMNNSKFESILNTVITAMIFLKKNIINNIKMEIYYYYKKYQENKKFLLNNNMDEYAEAQLSDKYFYLIKNNRFNNHTIKELLDIAKI